MVPNEMKEQKFDKILNILGITNFTAFYINDIMQSMG
jgi:hypothetical protein